MSGRRGDVAAGLFVLLLGLLALWQAAAIPESPLYAQVGPRAVPYAVAAGLLLLALALLAQAARGVRWAESEARAAAAPFNPVAFGLLGAGLLVNLALIEWLGFVPATAAQFVLVSAAFGSRRWLRDAAVGLAVSLAAFLFFTRVLGVTIQAGLLEGLL